MSTSSAPVARENHTALWTGTQMLVWGGYHTSELNDGGRYNPVALIEAGVWRGWSSRPRGCLVG